MEFRELTLDLREKIDGIRKAAGHTASSHAFVSLYLWRNAMELSVAFSENAFLIKSKNGYFFPCGKAGEVATMLSLVWEKEPAAPFLYAREEDLLFCKKLYGCGVREEYDAASREYLYQKSEQIAMSGKRFTYQRAKVNKARRLGKLLSVELTGELASVAKGITEEWVARRKDAADFAETLDALDNMDALGMYGNLLYLDGQPIGFNLGSFLTEQIFDIHIAKTLIDDVDTLMKWELYKALPDTVEIINREEDLGIRGLAIHKMDGQPIGFNHTYRILPICEESTSLT